MEDIESGLLNAMAVHEGQPDLTGCVQDGECGDGCQGECEYFVVAVVIDK
jgi:hypothetical protein